MKIDLGNKPKLEVIVSGASYDMDVPDIRQAQKLRDKLQKEKADEIDSFIGFLSDLGLPEDVAEKLTPQQLTKLSEGILGDSKKK